MQNAFASSHTSVAYRCPVLTKPIRFGFILFSLFICVNFAQAAVPVVNTTIGVEKTGSEPFDATTWDGSDLNTAGFDQFEDNNVVRMQDSITYRVEVSANDSSVDNLIATVSLPDGKQKWIALPTGCKTNPLEVTPVSSISVDGYTMICNVGSVIEGATRVFFPAAKVIAYNSVTNLPVLNDEHTVANVSVTAAGANVATAGDTDVIITAGFKLDTIKTMLIPGFKTDGTPLYTAQNAPGPLGQEGMLLEYSIKLQYKNGSMLMDSDEISYKVNIDLVDHFTDDNTGNDGALSSGAVLYTWGPNGASGGCFLEGDNGSTSSVVCNQQNNPVIDSISPTANAGTGAYTGEVDGVNDPNIDIALTDIDVRDPDADGNIVNLVVKLWFSRASEILTHQDCIGLTCTVVTINSVSWKNGGGTFEGFNPVSTEDSNNNNLTNFSGLGEPYPNEIDYSMAYLPPGSWSFYTVFEGFYRPSGPDYWTADTPYAPGQTISFGTQFADHRKLSFPNGKSQGCDKIDTTQFNFKGLHVTANGGSTMKDTGYWGNTMAHNPVVHAYNSGNIPNPFNPGFDAQGAYTILYTDVPVGTPSGPGTAGEAAWLSSLRSSTCPDDVDGDGTVRIKLKDGSLVDAISGGAPVAAGPIDWYESTAQGEAGIDAAIVGNVTRIKQEFRALHPDMELLAPGYVFTRMNAEFDLEILPTAIGYGASKFVPLYEAYRIGSNDNTGGFVPWAATAVGSTDPNNAGFSKLIYTQDRIVITESSIKILKRTEPKGIKVVLAEDIVDFVIEPSVFGGWNPAFTTAVVTDTIPALNSYVFGSEMFSTDAGVTWLNYSDYIASSPAVTLTSPVNTSLNSLVWNFDSVNTGDQLPWIKYQVLIDATVTSGSFTNTTVLNSLIDNNAGNSPVSASYKLTVFPNFGLDVVKTNRQAVYSTNTPFTMDLIYKNLGGEDYGSSAFIDILPHNADGAGNTSGLASARVPPTIYGGSYEITAFTGANSETFYATNANPLTIPQDPCHEDNQPNAYVPIAGDLCYNFYISENNAGVPIKVANTFAGGSVTGTGLINWQQCVGNSPAACGALNAQEITAVLFTTPVLPSAAGGQTVSIEFSPLGNIGGVPDLDVDGNVTAASTGNIYTNNFGGRVPEISLVVISNDVSVTVVSNSVGNHLWFDTNGNGIDDAEPPMPGITVNLLDGMGNPVYVDPVTGGIVDAATPGAIPYVAVTDMNGDYLFSNLPDGTYQVSVDATTLPLGLAQTYDADGLATPNVSTIVLAANTDVFGNIISGNDDDAQDFGYQQQGYLGDYVWYDANQDGVQDASEVGVNGITVNLYSTADCSGPVTATTTTANGGTPAADGFYEFTPIPLGLYCIEFTSIPANHSISPTGAGTVSTDSNAVVDGADATIARITNINLTGVDPDEDMGIFVAGSVNGLLWCESDTNPNLVYDAGDGDTLQSNVTVNLYDDANCNNIIDGTDAASLVTQSTVAGNYSFMNLITGGPGAGNNPPGCYIVEVDTTDPDLGECYNSITAPQLFPTIDAVNPDNNNNDFGHEERLNIGDYVWYENNQDGLQDAVEPGVNGITVELYHTLDCTGPVLATTVTANGGLPAADGWYNFSPLASGDYCIQFSGLAPGWVITSQNQGADDSIDSDADTATAQIQNIVLIHDDLSNDMGVYAAIGNIPGQVYCDINLSLTYDAGEEQVGIAVTLLRDTDCDGTGDVTVATLDTDATGSFDFTNLPVGLSPIPPNPAACYVLNYDLVDTDLTGCSQPFLPVTSVVELSTDTPAPPPSVFGNHVGPPMMIPVNKWWALLALTLMIFMVGKRCYKQD